MGEIEVGYMRSGQDIIRDVAVRIPIGYPPAYGCFRDDRHGKEQFHEDLLCVVHEGEKIRAPIVDPHGEYVSGGKSWNRRTHERTRPLHGREGRPRNIHDPRRAGQEEVWDEHALS